MRYYSTKNHELKVGLHEAVFRGLAEDGGLYMPEKIPVMPGSFLNSLDSMDFQELSIHLSSALFGQDITDSNIIPLVHDALNFDIPLVKLTDKISTLELFHGPTLAFKDVGARFMARMMAFLIKDYPYDIHVLVATSGDTGSAVANGFLGVEGIRVHVLYPRNKVSKIQEIQFTTLEENITALEIDGTFDDCQRLVKEAFNDTELKEKLTLTSANSINLARLLPQSFYYFNAIRQIQEKENVVFCIPSGNFGNLTAGLVAARMGLPVKHFITATNVNDIVPSYLRTGIFSPKPSVSTLANAMDVGNPSNFDRMLDLYDHSHKQLKSAITGYSYTDLQIMEGIKKCNKETGYILDPHGSTGYLAAYDYLRKNPGDQVIFFETAHPVKFRDTVEETLDVKIEVPERLANFFSREKKSIPLGNGFREFKDYLIDFI
jgi:threonine synthase